MYGTTHEVNVLLGFAGLAFRDRASYLLLQGLDKLLTSKNQRKKFNVDKLKNKLVVMFDCQSTTAKMSTNSAFRLGTCLLKLCKAACCATRCGSSDTSASASQNWSTAVYANKPTAIQALKEEIRRCISEIPPSKAEKDIYLMCCAIYNSYLSTLWLLYDYFTIKSKFRYFLKKKLLFVI